MFLDIRQIDRHPGSQVTRSGVCDFSTYKADGIIPIPNPVNVEAVASNRAGLLSLSIAADYELTFVCDRCAKVVTRREHRVFKHPIKGGYLDLNTSDDEDVVKTQEDGKLPIDDLLWEDIMLAMPTQMLCRDDCRGLCLSCGGDLNTGNCTCGEEKQVTMDD